MKIEKCLAICLCIISICVIVCMIVTIMSILKVGFKPVILVCCLSCTCCWLSCISCYLVVKKKRKQN